MNKWMNKWQQEGSINDAVAIKEYLNNEEQQKLDDAYAIINSNYRGSNKKVSVEERNHLNRHNQFNE